MCNLKKKNLERRKKNPRNIDNEITKKIEIEEKREEIDTLLLEMEIVTLRDGDRERYENHRFSLDNFTRYF
jgi:hypothetical protein